MHQEEMVTMEQLLQLYEGLHETIRRNELTIRAIAAGFVLLMLMFSTLSNAILWNPNIPGGKTGIALLFIPVLAFTLLSLAVGWSQVKGLKVEIYDAKTKLKDVVALILEYRQTLSGLNPVFLKAVDLRLLRYQ
ncbi:hypothetical protein [Stutzerimonas stutzeri]|uniref:hypothetical protein n=1 Tax=Stutzerimonas stutzeri TaxID=316 RepID=UPI001BCEC974|nr:hypothetical protein [Stutzerimonas stutzeri]